MNFRSLGLASLAILAFAGNSLLTRAALSQHLIGPGAFTAVRVAAGALILAALVTLKGGRLIPRRTDIPGILALLGYMVAFSVSYQGLGAATGALILFATVQLTMAGVSLCQGHALRRVESLGLTMALAGLLYLLSPGLRAPPWGSALAMAIAGVSWGVYTLLGRGAEDPIGATARNFIGCLPLAVLLPLGEAGLPLSPAGAALAIVSGAITSGLGYAVWYAALPRLPLASAVAAQLLTPAVAAAGAAIWLGEPLSGRLLVASAAILAGVGLTLWSRSGSTGDRSSAPKIAAPQPKRSPVDRA